MVRVVDGLDDPLVESAYFEAQFTPLFTYSSPEEDQALVLNAEGNRSFVTCPAMLLSRALASAIRPSRLITFSRKAVLRKSTEDD